MNRMILEIGIAFPLFSHISFVYRRVVVLARFALGFRVYISSIAGCELAKTNQSRYIFSRFNNHFGKSATKLSGFFF